MYADFGDSVHVMNPTRADKGMKLLLPFTATKSLFAAGSLLKSVEADAVLGTGGYLSFFVVAAARFLGIPAAIFDSNAHSGRSNRLASRFCKAAFTGLPGGGVGLHCPVFQTGTPVSENMKKVDVYEARKTLDIPEDRPVVLCLGGSQGAASINNLALSMGGATTVLLQCGNSDYERVLNKSQYMDHLRIQPFIKNLSLWYSAADLVVARAGGQTIAELAAFGLPAVLVPYPFAAEDHQNANAKAVADAGAALLVNQNRTASTEFIQRITALAEDTVELVRMSSAMNSIFPPAPADVIVSHLQEMIS
jgi:UDP-N-acetylglucosamine--N-acetylmuramyl-(pentapeptide) pyrophosphoryl-undecaprenol N-acetylglucosamine transferase